MTPTTRYLVRFGAFLTLVLTACSSGTATMKRAEPARTPQSRLKDAEKLRDLARFADAKPNVQGLRDYDVESYSLSGRFAWDTKQLEARVEIKLQLADSASTAIELDSRVTRINAVRIGEVTPEFTYDQAAGTLTVDLGRLTPKERADKILLSINYVRKATEDGQSGEHFDGSALRAVAARLGDPVRARTVNTMSEPRSASQWMPCKDDPADRATFAVELTLPKDESLIANGNLVRDEHLADGRRVMGYQTQYTLPTYLMAFAAGEFNVTMTELNGLPIGVWSRRGLPVDTSGVIENLRRLITRFTELVGPYGFDKYVIVFLPEFGGGEEHAGITFQSESAGTDTAGAGDLSMIGHELGHQWFGDFMTVKTWDDLWIKEGMASLLEAESNRPWEDQTRKNHLFGGFQWVDDGDAIIDPELDPDAKYTSGPYGRAAWLLTQMRAKLGDRVFFATLRQILQDHAYGNITTAEFLDAFRPRLGDEVIAKIEIALKAKALPKLTATKAEDGSIHMLLTDAEHALVVPFIFARLSGSITEFVTMFPDSEIVIPAGDTRPTIFDPRDVHCMQVQDSARQTYDVLKAPLDPETLLQQTSQAQIGALSSPEVWQITPEQYLDLKGQLGGEIAKAKAMQKACQAAAAETDAAKKAAWATAIDDALLSLPLLGLSSWYADTKFVALNECLAVASPGILDSTWARLRLNPAAFAQHPVEVETLAAFDLSPEAMLATWSPAALSGPTMRVKAGAALGLLRNLVDSTPPAAAPLATLPDWQSFFRRLLAENHAYDVLRFTLSAVSQTKDEAALPLLADVVRTLDLARAQRGAVCSARRITEGTDGAFARFAEPLLNLESLPQSVRAALTDAASCENR